jgi:hypothetical protein
MTVNEFMQKQKLPYEAKIIHAQLRAREFYEKLNGNVFCSVGGLDSLSMCGFGIHIEKRPHRFDRLREENPLEWKFWMYNMGWGIVLDYIGIKWEDEVRY